MYKDKAWDVIFAITVDLIVFAVLSEILRYTKPLY